MGPTKVIVGTGRATRAAHEARRLGGTRAMVFADVGIEKAGLLKVVLDSIGSLCVAVFTDIPQDSSLETVDSATKIAQNIGVDVIVSVGGGSVIDTSKAVCICLSQDGSARQNLGFMMHPAENIPHIVIPTTAGTGSEVTNTAVIHDTKLGSKVYFTENTNFPRTAILDPLMTQSLPSSLTSSTGMDALTHAIESVNSKANNPISDGLALESIRMVMKNLPVCASCHLFSKKGDYISMEMNYNNDSGAHFITQVKEKIVLSEEDFISWNNFPKPELLPKTRGLFAKMSPTGKYIVSTVHEISYAALTNDSAFCQLFFPTYGVLAWYSVDKKAFHLLPGAADTDFVQTDPSWSWDEKYIVFAKANTKNEYHEDISKIRTHIEDADIHELNQRFPIQFDLYKIPFNQGNGGIPEPLKGASLNSMSNYFPRFSPDGKWIVFTRSKTGIMLQPDSELFIIPAAGGEPRRMNCNRKLFNSWHSFSPNGNWMLFSSKTNTYFTEIFLTHIDKNGVDSPPICLSRLSEDRMAANVPEFVNIAAGAIQTIRIGDQ